MVVSPACGQFFRRDDVFASSVAISIGPMSVSHFSLSFAGAMAVSIEASVVSPSADGSFIGIRQFHVPIYCEPVLSIFAGATVVSLAR